MRVRFTEAARHELREAVRYYQAQKPSLGRAFRDELRSTVTRMQAYPDAWQLMESDIRRCRLHRFPYGVIYQVREQELLILAVAHLHRKPGYWKDRP